MGGSSLAPEVICETAGVELTVLDSSDPDMVRAATEDRLAETVVVVSSKSGGTVETDSQKRAYEKAFTDAGIDPAERIVVVTDPGSPLEQSARAAGYRVFLADPSVGGRYSALTAFGLVPSGLAGADIEGLLDGAEAVRSDARGGLGGQPRPPPGRTAGRRCGARGRQAGAGGRAGRRTPTSATGSSSWSRSRPARTTRASCRSSSSGRDAPNFDPSTARRGAGQLRPRRRGQGAGLGLARRGRRVRWARRCCSGSTPPRWPAG